jgi:Holliday junction resolvase-like predicted endonuclease
MPSYNNRINPNTIERSVKSRDERRVQDTVKSFLAQNEAENRLRYNIDVAQKKLTESVGEDKAKRIITNLAKPTSEVVSRQRFVNPQHVEQRRLSKKNMKSRRR